MASGQEHELKTDDSARADAARANARSIDGTIMGDSFSDEFGAGSGTKHTVRFHSLTDQIARGSDHDSDDAHDVAHDDDALGDSDDHKHDVDEHDIAKQQEELARRLAEKQRVADDLRSRLKEAEREVNELKELSEALEKKQESLSKGKAVKENIRELRTSLLEDQPLWVRVGEAMATQELKGVEGEVLTRVEEKEKVAYSKTSVRTRHQQVVSANRRAEHDERQDVLREEHEQKMSAWEQRQESAQPARVSAKIDAAVAAAAAANTTVDLTKTIAPIEQSDDRDPQPTWVREDYSASEDKKEVEEVLLASDKRRAHVLKAVFERKI